MADRIARAIEILKLLAGVNRDTLAHAQPGEVTDKWQAYTNGKIAGYERAAEVLAQIEAGILDEAAEITSVPLKWE